MGGNVQEGCWRVVGETLVAEFLAWQNNYLFTAFGER